MSTSAQPERRGGEERRSSQRRVASERRDAERRQATVSVEEERRVRQQRQPVDRRNVRTGRDRRSGGHPQATVAERRGGERRALQRRLVRTGVDRRDSGLSPHEVQYAYEKACRAHDLLAAVTATPERRLAAAVAELSHIPNVEGLPTETSRELFSRVMGYFARGEQRYDVISRLAKEDWRRIAETVEALRYELTETRYRL